jgi:hypothetical protein
MATAAASLRATVGYQQHGPPGSRHDTSGAAGMIFCFIFVLFYYTTNDYFRHIKTAMATAAAASTATVGYQQHGLKMRHVSSRWYEFSCFIFALFYYTNDYFRST